MTTYKLDFAVILVGLPGSGKTTAAAYLQRLGFKVVSAGDVIRDLCQIEGLPITRESLSIFGQQYLAQYGYESFGGLLLHRASRWSKVVFEGIRPPEVVHWLRHQVPKTITVYIEASERTRLKRLTISTGEDKASYDRVMKAPMERNITAIKQLADKVIKNHGSTEDLYSELRKILLPLLET